MFAKVAIISALAGLAVAAPVTTRDASTPFVAITTHSGNPEVHLRGIVASGSNFFLGKNTTATCPSEAIDCSGFQNTTTVFAYNANLKTLALDVAVPGGQQVYVDVDGALSYTIPHSNSVPTGAGIAPFEYTPQASSGNVGSLSFENGGFFACPVACETGVYQIYAQAYGNQTFYQNECIGVGFATSEYSGANAWEY